MAARGWEVREGEKKVRKIKIYKFPVVKQVSHRYEVYSVANRVCLYGERWLLDLSW